MPPLAASLVAPTLSQDATVYGSTTDCLALLRDVTAMQFIGDFNDGTEWSGEIGRVSQTGRRAIRNYIPYFAHHLRLAQKVSGSYDELVSAFNDAITFNLELRRGHDWAPMSDDARRFILIQRLLEEAFVHVPNGLHEGQRIDLGDFAEVLQALLVGSAANRLAFRLSMMHQFAQRDSEGRRRSGLGTAWACGDESKALVIDKLLRPVAGYLERNSREFLGL
jgi:hypothetical protein